VLLKTYLDLKTNWDLRGQNKSLGMDINEITYEINGAVFEVNKVLGPGFLEKVYQNALMFELKSRGLKAESQVPIKVFYKEDIVGEYIADILVEDKVIVELKTVETIDTMHEAQLLNYLKATGKQIGLLVNFKHSKAEIKRLVLDLPESDEGSPNLMHTGPR
jgi:GxxExxY protein